MPIQIGKVVKANSHTDYVCQIYGPGEIQSPPSPNDYAFGAFVRVALGAQSTAWLAGLIYDTVLLNPDFGRLGPRLSSPSELAVFSPDYLNEKATLVGITAIGIITSAGQASQNVPLLAAMTDSAVERMSEEQIRLFHGEPAALRLAYLPRVLTLNTPLAVDLLEVVLAQLQPLFPQPGYRHLLDLLLDHLRWRRYISPFGGN